MDEAKLQWKKKGGGYQDDITIGVLYLPLWHEDGAVATKTSGPVAAAQVPQVVSNAAQTATSMAVATCTTGSDSDSDSDDDMAAMIMAAAAKSSEKPVEVDLRAHLAKKLGT